MFQWWSNTFNDVQKMFVNVRWCKNKVYNIFVGSGFAYNRRSIIGKKVADAERSNNYQSHHRSTLWNRKSNKNAKSVVLSIKSLGTVRAKRAEGIRSISLNEWGFSNKMLDLTRHIDSVRKAWIEKKNRKSRECTAFPWFFLSGSVKYTGTWNFSGEGVRFAGKQQAELSPRRGHDDGRRCGHQDPRRDL